MHVVPPRELLATNGYAWPAEHLLFLPPSPDEWICLAQGITGWGGMPFSISDMPNATRLKPGGSMLARLTPLIISGKVLIYQPCRCGSLRFSDIRNCSWLIAWEG
ncbi:hypothetical protein AMTR_s00139p00060900 [Amborella trichopoda]|uniref:Uncharacterized protein n=1 Tax=Amborella trichopoda TaxID=13333 RepID=W1NFD1_AMBTC|nr:hypothetical protein AMTR_s00139p00060900 [Amborella trichopoda]